MKLKSKWKTLFALWLPLAQANGQYSEWTNTGSGDWFTPANWSTGSSPSSYTDAAVGRGLAEISSGTAQARQIYLGTGGTGAMTISNGAALETGIGVTGGYYTVLGYGNGSATVTGGNSTWTFGVPIYVGVLGTGSLSIENGGKVRQSDTSNWGNSLIVGGSSGNGSVTVSGTGSSLTTRTSAGIHIGNDHKGSLTISNGGSASVGYAYVGGNAGSNGTVAVTGTNSKWTVANSMWIATYGNVTGSLTVSAGGNVTTGGDIFLGDSGRSSVLVTGAGSILRAGSAANANIWLARSAGGNATLTVADGGTVRAPGTWPMGIIYLTSTSSNASSHATLRIGNGGQAGAVLVSGVDGGHGQARLVFDHSESAYIFNPSVTGSTNIEQVGSGTTILAGNNGYAGSTKILGGKLAASSIQNFGWTGDITIGSAGLRADASIDFGTGSVPYGGRLFHLTGAAEIEAAAAETIVTINRTVDGGGSLTKTGQGELLLTGSATHTGGTFIESGILRIGGGGTTGSIAGNIENNASLIFDRADDILFDGIVSGTGNLTKQGTGILTLANDNTYAGATFIKAGTLTVSGAISGAGGLVTIDSGATLNGSGTVNRDIMVNGTLASSLIVTGQVTLANQQSIGAVSSGTATAGGGQQIVVTSATGGTVDAAAGTAMIENLNGATLNSGNWGATVVNLTSGTVNTSGGSLVAQQGEFSGSISGTGGLTKTGDGTLVINAVNTYAGGTIVSGGTLQAAVGGATGTAPIRLVNNGRFRAMGGVNVSTGIISENGATTYEKVFNAGESLGNFGSLTSSMGGKDSTAFFAAGTTGSHATASAHFSASASDDFLLSDRLTIDGLDGTTFLLVMDSEADIPLNAGLDEFFLGWFDTEDAVWKNAVEGNHAEHGSLAGGYRLSYQDFLATNGGWDAEAMLGAYGVDAISNQVWAVIDHNSEFGAVPEPGVFALTSLGLGALLIRRRATRHCR
jgi:autotransporter-associated beta strand protein/T5SS/PEP-CTERM-associated repeat protein